MHILNRNDRLGQKASCSGFIKRAIPGPLHTKTNVSTVSMVRISVCTNTGHLQRCGRDIQGLQSTAKPQSKKGGRVALMKHGSDRPIYLLEGGGSEGKNQLGPVLL